MVATSSNRIKRYANLIFKESEKTDCFDHIEEQVLKVSTTRIAGRWKLYLSTIDAGKHGLHLDRALDAVLNVTVANRAGIEATLSFEGADVPVKGRVKPGTPSVVTLEECGADGTPLDDGFEAILYVPPWRPNIDYDFDIVCGTAVIGGRSNLGGTAARSRVLAVTGLQAAE